MVRARDVKSLASLGVISDLEYRDQEILPVLAERQVASFFKKNGAFTDDTFASEEARKSFFRGEKKCRITNRRLDHYFTRPDRIDPTLKVWLSRMEKDICLLLGDVGRAEELFRLKVRLTNGATEDRPRRRSYPYLKITGKLRAPRGGIPYVKDLLDYFHVDPATCKYRCVENNTVVLVPKSWKTHRTIAKEPTHSLPFQLALDSFLKRKLRKWGIDLSSQEKNQELARLGSLDGALATIDLSMASDTLSYNAVAWMLPWEWFKLFTAFRSSSFKSPWGDGVYSKFSSMGNGYTFSLETLIFGAACRAVGSRQFAVYGDDIVIETDKVPNLVRLLSFLGFLVNKEKSFVNRTCLFRESCGHDYFKGRLVTPFYIRELPEFSDKSGMCHVLNGLLAISDPGPLWETIVRLIRKNKLRLVPFNEDTRSGIFVSPHQAYRMGKIKTNRKPSIRGRPNPMYGFPSYEGYGVVQEVRKTYGRRSLFLWFLQKNGKERDVLIRPSFRQAQLMLDLNRARDELPPEVVVTSEVVIRSRYVHKTRRYQPVRSTTPNYLFLWDEVIGFS